jgi:hypothetical protein
MSKAKGNGGGGIGMNKNRTVSVRAGAATANKISEKAVSRIGQQIVTTAGPVKLVAGTAPQSPLGNALATNVGKGGPGAGRTVHPNGSQSPTPAAQPMTGGREIFPGFGGGKSN